MRRNPEAKQAASTRMGPCHTPIGVHAIFAYGGVHAMFWGLKFHLKAIFGGGGG